LSFLGVQLSSPVLRDAVFETEFDAARAPALRDHQLFGRVVVSGVVHMALAAAALEATSGPATALACADVRFLAPLVLPERGSLVVQTILDPASGAFQIASQGEAGAWTIHTRGSIRRIVDAAPPAPRDIAAIIARGTLVPDFYERLLSADEHWLGLSFRTITRLWRRDGEALAELALPADDVVRPPGCALELTLARRIAIGEVYGQVLMPAVPDYERILSEGGDTFVGHEIAGSVDFVRALERARYCHAVLDGELVGDLMLLDADGVVLSEVRGLKVSRISRALVRGVLAAATRRVPTKAPEVYLRELVARILGVGADGIRASDAPRDLGLDSLMIVELRDTVVAELGVTLPVAVVAGGATIAELARLLAPPVTPR
jgi:acyl carrier protein